MAEVLAVAGSVAAVIQLAEYSKRFLKFLRDYQAKATNMPLPFQSILSQQYLLIHSLKILEVRAQQHQIDDDMILHILLMCDACYKEMDRLDSVLNKFVISSTSSRAKKAFKAVRHEKEIQRRAATIIERFNVLFMVCQITSISFDQASSTIMNTDRNDSESLATLDEPTQRIQEMQTVFVPEAGKEQNIQQQTALSLSRCNCRRREYFQSLTSWSLGSASVSSEIVTHHRSGCPCYTRSAKQHRLFFNLRYTSVMLNIIARVSMSMAYGAGGLSLSPNLTIKGMRRENSPAFRLFDRAEWEDCYTVADAMAKMNQVSLRLQQMFDEGLASPFDLDQRGNSLFWVCKPCYKSGRTHGLQVAHSPLITCHWEWNCREFIEKRIGLLKLMESLGVPFNETAECFSRNHEYVLRTFTILYQADPFENAYKPLPKTIGRRI